MKLQNQIALVTGASRGIGRAIAKRLSCEGADVVVQYKGRSDAANEVVEQIEAQGRSALAVQADLAQMSDVRRLMGEVKSTFGHLNLLINNAGAAVFNPLADVTEEEFDSLFAVNVKGLFFTTQEAVKLMSDGGRIVNISSGITRANVPGGSAYAGTKAAVEAFTRCWAAELGPRQITVNTVSPGMTQTDLLLEVTPPEVLETMKAQTPLGRLGDPEDIADVVAYLCTNDARWLTAQNILANGGVG